MAKVKINSTGGEPNIHVNKPGYPGSVVINPVLPTPGVPILIEQNNVTNQLWFHAPSGYKATDCAYTISGGAATDCTSTVIEIGDNARSTGVIAIYVKASPGQWNQGPSVTNSSAYTVSASLSAPEGHSNDAASYPTNSSGQFVNFADNGKIITTGIARKIQFKLGPKPSALTYLRFVVYRVDGGGLYDIRTSIQNICIEDLVWNGALNTRYIDGGGWSIGSGDVYGWVYNGNTSNASFFLMINNTNAGTRSVASLTIGNDVDFAGGTSISDQYHPVNFLT
jgi:hypothetical protein